MEIRNDGACNSLSNEKKFKNNGEKIGNSRRKLDGKGEPPSIIFLILRTKVAHFSTER